MRTFIASNDRRDVYYIRDMGDDLLNVVYWLRHYSVDPEVSITHQDIMLYYGRLALRLK
jgi:hypothetical protein